MRSLLNKIFSRRLGLGKFIISAIAFLFGLTLVLLSVQAYIKINSFLAPKNNVSDYIIVNKEVGIGNTLFGSKADFKKEDIENLKKQEFAESVGAFTSNQFKVKAYAGGELGFYTELFFESVPDEFIDDKPYNFKWKEGSGFLPIIVSQDFLNLYNFGFALGRGTPQLSKSTIGFVPLKVEIEGPQGKKIYDARVVGFSERIPSVLVPQEFLQWANKNIGENKEQNISRAIIKVKSDKSSMLEKYFEEHNLKVSEDKIKFSRISTMVNIIMSVLVVVGTAFIIFSLVIVVMNFTLIVSEAKEEITLLLQLGYKTKFIVKHLSLYLMIFLGIVTAFSAALFYFLNSRLDQFLTAKGFQLGGGIEQEVIWLGLLFIAISIIVTFFSIQRTLRQKT